MTIIQTLVLVNDIEELKQKEELGLDLPVHEEWVPGGFILEYVVGYHVDDSTEGALVLMMMGGTMMVVKMTIEELIQKIGTIIDNKENHETTEKRI